MNCPKDKETVGTLIKDIAEHDDKAIYDEEGVRFGLHYLRAFGYFAGKAPRDLTLGDIAQAVQNFQSFFAIEETGRLDDTTVRAMTIPRCGVSDVQPMRLQANADGSLPLKGRWNKKALTYCVESRVNGLSVSDQDDILKMAWKNWSDVCDLKFTQVTSSNADIIISTGRGARDQFDGPSGTLAWAYLPPGTDEQLLMRFDLDESWSRSASDRGILMLNVACHEFGHLLGLEHSKVSSALMAPYYSPAVSKPQVNDDIPRIQQIYGKAAPAPAPTPAPTTPASPKTLTISITGDVQSITIPGYRVTKLG